MASPEQGPWLGKGDLMATTAGGKSELWEVLTFVALAVAGVFIGASVLEKLGKPSVPCPSCGRSVKVGTTPCPYCRTPLRWDDR